jgi:hypothetical protein
MTRQHHASFAQTIITSSQRIFRSRKPHNLVAPNQLNAHTMRDIGLNPVGL